MLHHIYSDYYKQPAKITEKKPEIHGVVLHDDAENNKAVDYIQWLQRRIDKDELEKGWGCVYVDKESCYWFHPSNYIEWHCGEPFANAHFIGIERCQSLINGVLSDKAFMENEETSYWIAALLLKKYNLPITRETVRLHKEFSDTACPARAWQVHLGDVPTNEKNINKLKDYFIEHIKRYSDQITKDDLDVLG
ncbi:N-acetylmuramoyl-L-alanine amidase [Staphylococcus sp. HKU1]|uniref:peptidoglycan recognition protein family protein n=1 Tax=Staphylococcus sp. HKU1 TaxID=3068989 RepID=UPI003AAFE644